MAFKQGAGVLKVLFGVGLGGGDAVEGFVEDGDDAVLFGEGGKRDGNLAQVALIQFRHCQPRDKRRQVGIDKEMNQPVVVKQRAIWAKNMSVVIHPALALDGKSRVLSRCPLCTVLTNQH